MKIEEAREGMKALLLAHQISITTEPERFKEKSIRGDHGAISLRIYQPENFGGNKNTVILFFHGGGWVLGDLECYENMLQYLCQHSKVTIISVGYSLAPEHKFPAAIQDCYEALSWVASNGNILSTETDKIIVMGDSAGANLAAALCLYTRDVNGPVVYAQILLYPQLCLVDDELLSSRDEFGNGEFFISRDSIAWAVEHYLNNREEALSELASPLFAEDYSRFPRTLILTAGLDPLRDEAELFNNRLRDSGIDTDYRCFEHTIHGFLSLAGTLEVGKQGLDYLVHWIRQHT